MIGGFIALLYLSTAKKTGEKFFNVPGHGSQPESALPGLGYIKLRGQWFLASAVNAAAIQAGGAPGQTIDETSQIFATIMAILGAGVGLYNEIKDITNANRAEAITQILNKYSSPASPNYTPNFYFNQNILETKTNPELKQILEYGFLT